MATECERFRDDLALLAVDDPESSPSHALLQHVDRCPSCRAFLRRSRESLARLVLEQAAPPPPGVKTRLMAAIDGERRNSLPPGAGETARRGPSGQELQPPSTAERPAPRSGLRAGWQAAAILLLVVSLVANGYLLLDRRGNGDQDALVAQLEALQAVLFAPDYAAPRVFGLEAGRPGLSGQVAFCRVSDDTFYVMVASQGWTAEASGEEHRLWLQSGDRLIDGGGLTFSGDRGLALFQVSEPLPVEAVRLGPEGGSPLLWARVQDPWPPSGDRW